MKRSIFVSLALFVSFFTAVAQDTLIKSVKYARTEIEVPSGYIAKDDYSIQSELFSAQWLYLTNAMVDQGVQKQIIQQFENQLKYSRSAPVHFISNGAQFTGKTYTLKGADKMKFRILAFGSPDGQPLVLNMGFKDNPVTGANFDDLIKKFIRLEE